MKALIARLARLDALSARERVILLLLLLAGLWAVADVLVLTPIEREHKAQQSKIVTYKTQLAELQAELARRQSLPDPDALARQKLAQVEQTLVERLQATSELQKTLVTPKDTVSVLQGLLARQPGVHLIRLNTRPPLPVGHSQDAKPSAEAQPASEAKPVASDLPPLYKHSVEITVSGDYAALTRYMRVVETLPAGFYWEHASLDASRHPYIELRLILNTLSLDKTWLSL